MCVGACLTTKSVMTHIIIATCPLTNAYTSHTSPSNMRSLTAQPIMIISIIIGAHSGQG